MNGPFRMFYVQILNPLGEWLNTFYCGTTPPEDPLYQLLDPIDLRGEVNAWGGPHITVSDALRVTDPDRCALMCRSICARYKRPAISFADLDVYRTALVIRCESQELSTLRLELLEQTSCLIEREPLTDHEFQEALDRIGQQDGDCREHYRAYVETARREYMEHDSPPLPTSIHFRLPFLVGLCRSLAVADEPDEKSKRRERLEYYLKFRQPPWYASTSTLHLSICSGLQLDPTDEESRRRLRDRYRELLWGEIERCSERQDYRPTCLAIMGESATKTVRTRRWDGAIREHVEEERPQFVAVEQVPFHP